MVLGDGIRQGLMFDRSRFGLNGPERACGGAIGACAPNWLGYKGQVMGYLSGAG